MKQIYLSIPKQSFLLATLLFISQHIFAANIIVPSGQTLTYSQDMNGTVIEVSGTLNFSPNNINGNGNKVIIYRGGEVLLPSKTSLQNMQIEVRYGGTLNISSANFQLANNGGIKNEGTVNALSTILTIKGNVGLENSGILNVMKLEIMDGAPASGILRKNTGVINISGDYTNSGYYENATLGTIKVGGAFQNTDQGSNQLVNNGYIEIAQDATIKGFMTLNGTMIVNGDITIHKPITGNNGKLGVTNGNSKITGDGRYSGTNMRFCDKNTSSHNVDQINANNPASNFYTIDCSSVFATSGGSLPLRFISFEAVEYNKFTVYFKWTTTEESNIETLQLQGSVDGSNYVAIENIEANNTNGTHSYTSSKTESSRFTSYRIAVINKDGKREYSKIIYYRSAVKSPEVNIFPNPVTNGTFNVQVPTMEPVIINIFSNDGKVLFNTVLKGQQQYQVRMPDATRKFNLLIIQVVQNGSIKTFNVLNK